MIIGKVVGSLWATRKDEKLNGLKLLIVSPLYGNKQEEGYFVAADNAGAGTSDIVLVTQGSAARMSVGDSAIPVDAVIVGVIDSIEVDYE
ncbi:EutN/CcmL family microcompartment protein [Microbacteriaceae bacterium 4G12]